MMMMVMMMMMMMNLKTMMMKMKKAWPFMPIRDQSERFRARRPKTSQASAFFIMMMMIIIIIMLIRIMIMIMTIMIMIMSMVIVMWDFPGIAIFYNDDYIYGLWSCVVPNKCQLSWHICHIYVDIYIRQLTLLKLHRLPFRNCDQCRISMFGHISELVWSTHHHL